MQDQANTKPLFFNVSVIFKGETQQQVTLPATEVTIGRGSDCQVIIDNAGISRNHAKLECIDGQIQVTDLESGNGTFVNGNAVKKTVLQKSDTLRIGKYSVRVALTETPPSNTNSTAESAASGDPQSDVSKTVFLSPNERVQILKQSSTNNSAASTVKPAATIPSKSPSNPSVQVFVAGLVVGVVLCALIVAIF